MVIHINITIHMHHNHNVGVQERKERDRRISYREARKARFLNVRLRQCERSLIDEIERTLEGELRGDADAPVRERRRRGEMRQWFG